MTRQGTVLVFDWYSVSGYSPELAECWTCESPFISHFAHYFDESPEGNVYVTTLEDGIAAISAKGELLWVNGPEDWYMRSVVADPSGGVYATDRDNRLCRLNAAGDVLWTFDGGWNDNMSSGTGSEYYSLAVLSDGTALVDTRTGYPDPPGPRLYAVDKDGRLLWRSFNLMLADTGYLSSSQLLMTTDHGSLSSSGRGLQVFKSDTAEDSIIATDTVTYDVWVDDCTKINCNDKGHTLVQPFARWTADNVERHNRLSNINRDGEITWELDGPPEYYSPAFQLPDGRFVAVAWDEGSYLTLISADGELIRMVKLPGRHASYPVVAESGLVYLRTEAWLLAVDPSLM